MLDTLSEIESSLQYLRESFDAHEKELAPILLPSALQVGTIVAKETKASSPIKERLCRIQDDVRTVANLLAGLTSRVDLNEAKT